MKRNELRVAVARDVLKQLKARRYEARSGTYIRFINNNRIDEHSTSFKDYFKENKESTCEVCALGAGFVSLVNIQNKCSVAEMRESDVLFDRMTKLFGKKNLDLIESAFELSEMHNAESNLPDYMLLAASEWGMQYETEERLHAIMNNIIRNGGNFVVPKKFVTRATRIKARTYGY